MNVSFDDLLSTGAHFGHLSRNWHPNFQPYILMARNGIHIINLEETLKQLKKALDFLSDRVTEGAEILFVGTKKNARTIVQEEADKCGMFYIVERWLGGTLTNFTTIRKSIKRLHLLEKESSPLYENATKKEVLALEREMIRLQDLHRGIKDMKRLPDALFVVDANHEATAVSEARKLNIPVVAVVDTNTDPGKVDYPVPCNDDSIRAIKLIVGEVARSICYARSMPYPQDGVVLTKPETGPAPEPEETADTDDSEMEEPQKETAADEVEGQPSRLTEGQPEDVD